MFNFRANEPRVTISRQTQAMVRCKQIFESQAREWPPFNDGGGTESSAVFQHQDNLVQSGVRSILHLLSFVSAISCGIFG